MTTNTATSLPGIAVEHMSYIVSEVINNGENADVPQADMDDRSSSLSELGERAGHEEGENIPHGDSEVNDTEAETERLEESPQKQRELHNVVLTSTNGMYGDPKSSVIGTMLEDFGENGPLSDGDRLGQTSDISSLADSGDEAGNALSSTPPSSRKRKRSSFEGDSLSDREAAERVSPRSFGNTAADLHENMSPNGTADEEDQQVISTQAFPSTNSQTRKAQQYNSVKQTYKKGKRKGKKIRDDDTETMADEAVAVESFAELDGSHQTAYSNEEDMEADEVGDVREADHLIKTEEGGVQKKTALDSLHSMEKCFATLRDKIFDERLMQCNDELALLEQPISAHPELLVMREVIDQRRDQKIEYEHTLMKHKLTTLQRESVANKAQIHSQYMQSVREIRDVALDQLNREFYQLQRERRSCEGDVPEYMYNFTAKRSQQITQQMAYNSEVSVLSGVAKYVGFPAAPDISKARPNEIDDDLRAMGIASVASHTSQNHRPALRTNLSGTAGFSRQRPAAEEHFLEQNAWANPQHPSHHQQRQHMHRQVSALSRAATPASTPAAQRRVIDLTEPQGSASTIAEPPSGPSSCVALTSTNDKASKDPHLGQYRAGGDKAAESTPSRIIGVPVEATQENSVFPGHSAEKGKAPQSAKSDHSQSSSLQRNKSQESQTPNAIPKPLPFMHTGGSSSTPGIRTSTPVRYPAIKAEDASQHQRRSPHQYHSPAAIATVSSGQNRFST